MIEARTDRRQGPRVLRNAVPRDASWRAAPVAVDDHRVRRRDAMSRQSRPRRRLSRHWMFAASLIGFAGLYMALSRGGEPTPLHATTMEMIEQALVHVGLGLDQVDVSGHRFTADSDILDAIDLPHVRSLLSFDSTAVRRRIERLPWVATAAIHRVFPGVLHINIAERSAFAVWDQGANAVLVDASGRTLGAVARTAQTGLPRIAGAGAPADAARLLALVAAIPDLKASLDVAERVADRRWRLRLTNGSTIELPAEADAAALSMLVEDRPGGRLLDVAASTIDLTVQRRISVRGLAASIARNSRG